MGTLIAGCRPVGSTSSDDLSINVAEFVDQQPIGRRQVYVFVLCAFIAVLDGFDLQVIGLAGPAIAATVQISPRAVGIVFSAALAGLALGAFALGPMADRVGRKRVLVASTLCFGLSTFATASSGSFNELLLCRFLTGVGLGGAMPSFISLTSEYAPKNRRAPIIGLLWAGFPLGATLGGLLAAPIIPSYGWQALFRIGGLAPSILSAVLVFALPESVHFLVNRRAPSERIAGLLRSVYPGVTIPSDARFVLGEDTGRSASVQQLFTNARGYRTVLLWISFFVTFLMLVSITAWTPTLLRSEGFTTAESSLAIAWFNAGSLLGTSLAGYAMTLAGPMLVFPITFIGAAIALWAVGQTGSIVVIDALQALAGVCLGKSSSGLIVFATASYPTAVRSTGLGWAMAMGRLGSFLGPLVVGVLVGWRWEVGTVFFAIGAPAVVAASTTMVLGVDGKTASKPQDMKSPGPKMR